MGRKVSKNLVRDAPPGAAMAQEEVEKIGGSYDGIPEL